MQKALRESLKIAVSFLEENDYRYALIGGIALSQWGAVRVTRDVDFKVLVPQGDYKTIRQAIYKAFHQEARTNLPENPLIVSVLIQGVVVDFLLAIPGYEEKIIERSLKRVIHGVDVWVSSAEDLIVQKAVAARGRDWSDIEALLIEQKSKLDYSYIEDWLSQFSEVLENPNIINEYLRLKQKIIDLSD